jgi:hypothetical protein
MAARLGQIPELIQAVSRLAGPKASIGLMRSCRGFFDLLAPLVWEHVKGAEVVFSLVRGSKIVVHEDDTSVIIVSSLDYKANLQYLNDMRYLESPEALDRGSPRTAQILRPVH